MMFPLLPFWGLRFFMQKNSEEQIQPAKKLRSKYIHISNGMIRTGDIAAELFQSDVLTEKERDDIQHLLSTPIRANEQLLNTLMLKDSRAFGCFLRALSNTKQTHIAEFLKCDGKYLDTKHSLMIQRNYMTLIDNLDVDGGFLLDRLKQDDLIADREVETINAKLTKHEKIETLLALVSKFSVDNFDKFLQALEESSQEHVVSILRGKYYPKSESTTVESTLQCEHSELREQQNPEVQQNSNQNLRNNRQINILQSTEGIEAPSFHVIRKSIITFGSQFTQLPDELQTELARKVASLRQKTVCTNVDICYLKLLQGKEVNRKQTEFEDINETLRRVNESVEKTALIFKDDLKTEILNEELEWHRNNNRHLDEALKISVIDLSKERQKSKGFEMQFAQHQKENEEMKKDRDELRRSLHMSMKCIDDFKKQHEKFQKESETLRKEKDELERSGLVSKSRIEDLIGDIQRYQKETEYLRKEKDELERSELVSKSRVDDLICEIRRNQKETEELLKERDGFQNSMGESKQRIGDLVTQIEQYQNETMHFQKQRDELQKQLDEARVLMEANRKSKPSSLMDRIRKSAKQEQLQRVNEALPEKYRLDPVLVQTIETKVKNMITGLTILDAELFVVSENCSKVEVYNSVKFSFSRRWKLKELLYPMDIGSCNINKCLFIFDFKGKEKSKEILGVDPNGKLIKKWSTGGNWGYGLSVTDESTVILTVYTNKEGKLNEYSPDGQLVREINLSHAGIICLSHAIKLANGHFLVTHGDGHKYLANVCVVDADGNLKKSFDGKCGSTTEHLGRPCYLAVDGNGFVMVADEKNDRVLLLDLELEFKRELLSIKKHRFRDHLSKFLLDQTNNQLLVIKGREILIFSLPREK